MRDRIEAEIDYVDLDECAVVLQQPSRFNVDKPVVIAGIPRWIITQCEDKLWVDSVEGLDDGQLVVQESIAATDQDIIARLESVWRPRWNKIQHVADGQWTQINAFAERVLSALPWSISQWDGDLVRQVAQAKKSTAAVGPDGVSRADVVSLPGSCHEAFAKMYQAAEGGLGWPTQLATGFVSIALPKA